MKQTCCTSSLPRWSRELLCCRSRQFWRIPDDNIRVYVGRPVAGGNTWTRWWHQMKRAINALDTLWVGRWSCIFDCARMTFLNAAWWMMRWRRQLSAATLWPSFCQIVHGDGGRYRVWEGDLGCRYWVMKPRLGCQINGAVCVGRNEQRQSTLLGGWLSWQNLAYYKASCSWHYQQRY